MSHGHAQPKPLTKPIPEPPKWVPGSREHRIELQNDAAALKRQLRALPHAAFTDAEWEVHVQRMADKMVADVLKTVR